MSNVVSLSNQQFENPSVYIASLRLPAWIFDQQTLTFLDVNAAAIEEYGFSREQFMEMTILDIRPAKDVQKILRKTLHPGEKGPSVKESWQHMRCDGSVFYVEITSYETMFRGHEAEIVVAVPTAHETPSEARHKKNVASSQSSQFRRLAAAAARAV